MWVDFEVGYFQPVVQHLTIRPRDLPTNFFFFGGGWILVSHKSYTQTIACKYEIKTMELKINNPGPLFIKTRFLKSDWYYMTVMNAI